MTISGEEVVVRLSAERSSVSAHEPILARLTLENRSALPVTFDLGSNRTSNLRLIVTDPDGGIRAASQRVIHGLSLMGRATILPGATYEQRLVLNEWHDFAVPGDYEVRLELSEPIAAQTRTIPPVRLRVMPRDPERLRLVAEELAASAGVADVETASSAALALSHLKDPVAVPYLAVLLTRRGGVQALAIAGLGRIRSPEALQLLRGLSEDRSSDAGALARQALSAGESAVMD